MFMCKECNQVFTRNHSLKRHLAKGHIHACNKCDETFTDPSHLFEHRKSHFFTCKYCAKSFTRNHNLKKHTSTCSKKFFSEIKTDDTQSSDDEMSDTSEEENDDEENSIDLQDDIYCEVCCESYRKKSFTSHLRSNKHIEKALNQVDDDCYVYQTALKNNLMIYRIPNKTGEFSDTFNTRNFLGTAYHCVEKILNFQLEKMTTFKFRFNLVALYTRGGDEDDLVYEESSKHFQTRFSLLTKGDDLDEIYLDAIEFLVNETDEFEEMMSGWTIIQLLYLDLEILKVRLIGGSSYLPTPYFVGKKKCCINVENANDKKCFLYAVLSIIFFNEIPNEMICFVDSYQPYLKYFNTSGIKFPVSLRDIKLFERLNSDKEISVNVYTVENQQIVGPLYLTQKEKSNHVNLLLLNSKNKSHYISIIDLSRLVRSQMTKNTKKKYFCNSCITSFKAQKDLDFHHEIGCGKVKPVLPEDPFLEFKNYKAKQKHPFCMYGDLECILKKYNNIEPSKNQSFSLNTQLHMPASYAYSIQTVNNDVNLDELRLYRGEDCMSQFVESIVRDVNYIDKTYLKYPLPMEHITDEIREQLNSQLSCILCDKIFVKDDEDIKVVDHCHITGKIRGFCHQSCNLKCPLPKFIPFFFHCGSSYDFHILIMAFGNKKFKRIKCIPKTKENYISFSVYIPTLNGRSVELRFLDSYRFLPESISKLTESLPSCPNYRKFHEKSFGEQTFWKDPQKQFLPYEYFDDFEKFSETALPPIDKFYSSLSDDTLNEEQYQHAQLVFNNLENKTLGGYIDYYLSVDVYLLRDVMESFRESLMTNFLLDPVFYFTVAGFSFDACLQHIKQKIGLMTSINMINMIKSGIRGGISCAMHRFAEANNKYLKEGYNPDKGPETYLMYIDCNGLYTYTMMNYPLPISDYEWVRKEELDWVKQNFMDIPADGDTGYIFLCDVEYPPHLHDLHNDLPFCVETMKIGKVNKLVPNLYEKKNYCCHYTLLQQAIHHGLKLKAIHKVIKFKQSYWLRSYIELCATLRQDPNNSLFLIQLYKNLANVIFGKMIQSTMTYKDVKLVTEWLALGKRLSASSLGRDPRFRSFVIFAEEFVAIEMQRLKVKHDRPTIVGFSILDLSKTHMYKFIYSSLQRNIGQKHLKISYIDTDGIVIIVEKIDIYKYIKEHPEEFDTSDYSLNNQFGITPQNRKVPGLFHDEGKGFPVKRFIALRPKSYAIEFECDDKIKLIKKLKSVSKNASKTLQFQDYLKVWENKSVAYAKMFRIYSSNHILRTVMLNKKSMCGKDDKRYILSDNISTLALGHKDIINV